MKIWILCAKPCTVSNNVKLLITWFKELFILKYIFDSRYSDISRNSRPQLLYKKLFFKILIISSCAGISILIK